jgi:hypothetical protein
MPHLLAEPDMEEPSTTWRRGHELGANGTPGEMQDRGHDAPGGSMVRMRDAGAGRRR